MRIGRTIGVAFTVMAAFVTWHAAPVAAGPSKVPLGDGTQCIPLDHVESRGGRIHFNNYTNCSLHSLEIQSEGVEETNGGTYFPPVNRRFCHALETMDVLACGYEGLNLDILEGPESDTWCTSSLLRTWANPNPQNPSTTDVKSNVVCLYHTAPAILDNPATGQTMRIGIEGGELMVYGRVGNVDKWSNLGSPADNNIYDSPSVVYNPISGNVEVYVTAGRRLWEKYWHPGTGWSGWIPLGGDDISGSPVAIYSPSTQHIDVYVASEGHLELKYWGSSGWSPWHDLGGPASIEGLTAVRNLSNQNMEIYAISGGQLYEKYWSPSTSWSTWQNLGGTQLAGTPSVVYHAANSQMQVFARSGHRAQNGSLAYRSWSPSGWGSWADFGGAITGNPAAIVNPRNGNLQIFASSNGQLVEKYWSSTSGWQSWLNHGGTNLGSKLTVTYHAAGQRVGVYAQSNGQLKARFWSTSGWAAWGGYGPIGGSVPLHVDFNGDGLADVIGRNSVDNNLYLYNGNGSGNVSGGAQIGQGWGQLDAMFSAGDFDRDGKTDILGRNSVNNSLYLFSGNGAGDFIQTTVIGTGWQDFDVLLSPGDFNGDGNADVIGRHRTDHKLYLYPGNGSNGFLAPSVIGTDWHQMNSIFSPGDFNGDGKMDVLARNAASGDLYMFSGNGSGGFGDIATIGTGWGAYDLIFSSGDMTGDGHSDVIARHAADHRLYLFAGDGKWGMPSAPVYIGTNWNQMNALL